MISKVLVVDTSTENCSVALSVGSDIIVRCEMAPREHTRKILPFVDEVLVEAGLTLRQLDALAFGRGPGSFTGVRIGIGIAQGLAFGADLPMIGVSTLAAMAQQAYRKNKAEHVFCAIDARMGEIYWGQYFRLENGDWQILDKEAVLSPQNVEPWQKDGDWSIAGTGWQAYPKLAERLPIKVVNSGVLYPESQDMVILAKHAHVRGDMVAAEKASPVYLRDTVAWKKLPGK